MPRNPLSDERLASLLAQATEHLEPIPSGLTGQVRNAIRRERHKTVLSVAGRAGALAACLCALAFWFSDDLTSNNQEILHPSGQLAAETGAPEVVNVQPEVYVRSDDNSIIVPVSTPSTNISIFWVYPTISRAESNSERETSTNNHS